MYTDINKNMRKKLNNADKLDDITGKLDKITDMLDNISDTKMLHENDFIKLRASRIMLLEIMMNIQENYEDGVFVRMRRKGILKA